MSSVPASRERTGNHFPGFVAFVAIIAECRHGLERRLEVARFENMPGLIGVIRPGSGQKIRLKLEAVRLCRRSSTFSLRRSVFHRMNGLANLLNRFDITATESADSGAASER
jgi:hypothetical protein